MSEQERETTGNDVPEELDPDVEAHLLKETLAAGAAAATMFAGTSVAGAVVMPGPGGAGPAVVDPGPGSGGNAVVDPGPGSGGNAVVDPGPGGGAGVGDQQAHAGVSRPTSK